MVLKCLGLWAPWGRGYNGLEGDFVKTASPVVLTVLFLSLVTPAVGLKVALDDHYPPYSFRESGVLRGISVDEWTLWSQKTGVPVELEGMAWTDALAAMDAGRVDVLDTVFLTPARSEKWSFTEPYAPIAVAVFQRNGLTGFQAPSDLRGFAVGVKTGDAGADALRTIGSVTFVEYASYEALIDAAIRGDILVFCMDVPPAVHLLLSKGQESRFRQAFVLAQDSFRRAVPKTRPDVMALVNRGFGLITPAEAEAIEHRWLGTPLTSFNSPQTIWLTVIVSLMIVAILVGLVVALRRQVAQRAGQLAGAEERLKLSEDRARALVAALPDLLFILDAEGLILESLGPIRNELYHDPNRFVGLRIDQAFGSQVADEVISKVNGLSLSGEVATVEADLDIRGDRRTFESRMVRLADQRILAIVRDVTLTRQAWKDNLHRNKLESLELLAGGLAHDFNNNLAAIQGFVSLAKLQLAEPAKASASLDKAVLATRRAAGLTGQLRVLAHGGEVHRTILSVRPLAEEAASLALVGSSCLLSVESDSGPWVVEADPEQLSQVFHNLVLNAVQAMSQGGIITLVFRQISEESISVSVVDEGDGIAPEHLERIFDPYFTTRPKGSGLGLSVVRAVVQHHGGKLEVSSRPGRGTVFTVTLPAASGQPVVPPRALSTTTRFADHRALIMEDEADLRDLIGEICRSMGFDAHLTSHGADALTAFDRAVSEGRPFDLLVSDLLVPGAMGGQELVTRLRTKPLRFKALAVTGFSPEAAQKEPGASGFDMIVGKPFTVEELQHRITELMNRPWKTEPTP